MKKNIVFSVLIVAILFVLGYLLLEKTTTRTYSNFHFAYEKNSTAYTGIEKPVLVSPIKNKVYGMIVSHHFYMEREISNAFLAIKNQKPEIVVIVGPDHFSASDHDLTISSWPYKTPFGILEPNQDIIDKLIDRGLFSQEKPFEHEHSISSLVGIIKAIFPKTHIVPIIINRNAPLNKINELALDLNSLLPENSLVVASVDFSHHQNRFIADFHDEKSISAIQSFNFENLGKLEIDSPQSIFLLEKYLEMRSAKQMSFQSTNYAKKSGNLDSQDVTSYLFAHFTKGEETKNEAISVLNFGDAMFDRGVKEAVSKGVNPFGKIKGVEENFFRGQDFISLNLEGPITDNKNCFHKPVNYKFEPETAALLYENKINIANIANNHSFDCGEAGYVDTINNLTKHNIDYFGRDTVVIKQIQNKKLAFAGFNLLSPTKEELKNIYERVEALNLSNDYVIVNLHWGTEYNSKANDYQVKIAHELISRGADAIIGHHPHVVQNMEIYQGKPIFYSLGNFIFDQRQADTTLGIGVGLTFSEKSVGIYVFPYEINNLQPRLLESVQMNAFCNRLLQDQVSRDGCYVQINKGK